MAGPHFGARRASSIVAAGCLLLLLGPGVAAAAPLSTVDDPAHAAPPVSQTPWGPLSQDDQTLLDKVRQADLWEGPVSGQVAASTTDAKVRAVATQLMNDHRQLDQLVTAAAAQLGVVLPTTPTPLQQLWTGEILARSGTDRDDTYANLVREAHGTVFMFVSKVRSETQNDVIRSFAQATDQVVMRHMTLLESTDMVSMASMLTPSTADTTVQPLPSRGQLIGGIVLALLVMAGTFWGVRASSRRATVKAQD